MKTRPSAESQDPIGNYSPTAHRLFVSYLRVFARPLQRVSRITERM